MTTLDWWACRVVSNLQCPCTRLSRFEVLPLLWCCEIGPISVRIGLAAMFIVTLAVDLQDCCDAPHRTSFRTDAKRRYVSGFGIAVLHVQNIGHIWTDARLSAGESVSGLCTPLTLSAWETRRIQRTGCLGRTPNYSDSQVSLKTLMSITLRGRYRSSLCPARHRTAGDIPTGKCSRMRLCILPMSIRRR
jgi:hypothetical protein